MRKAILVMLIISSAYFLNAQNMGIGTTSPNPSAAFEVASSNKGFLPPRVSLTSLNDISTILSPATGLIVYNIASSGTIPNNVTPGYYSFTGAAWRRIGESGSTSGDMQYWNGSQWVLLPGGSHGQTLVMCNGVPSWGPCIPSVNICGQIWMKNNLDLSVYRNGDPIPQVTDGTTWNSLTTGAWCWYANDSATYAATFGKIYNFYAVSDPRGLAPEGWHIPNDAEWNVLINSICVGGNTFGGANLKDTVLWNPGGGSGANNSTGFSARPGGYNPASNVNQYVGAFDQGSWWTSTPLDVNNAWFYHMYYYSSATFHDFNSKKYGMSVRCVKD